VYVQVYTQTAGEKSFRKDKISLAGVDLVAEDLAEVAWLRAEDFLYDGRVTQPCKDCGDATAYLPELRRDAGNKDAGLIHGTLNTKGFRRK
jgi:hypothetical protein